MRFKESGHRAIASGQARAADLQLPSNTPLNRHVQRTGRAASIRFCAGTYAGLDTSSTSAARTISSSTAFTIQASNSAAAPINIYPSTGTGLGAGDFCCRLGASGSATAEARAAIRNNTPENRPRSSTASKRAETSTRDTASHTSSSSEAEKEKKQRKISFVEQFVKEELVAVKLAPILRN